MSLLTIVQAAARRCGLPVPASVMSATDEITMRLLAIANEEGEELSTGVSVGLSYDWQALQTEASFTSVAVESQGLMTTIAPGFKYIIGGTIWDRTKRLPAYGSVTPEEWQAFKAWSVTDPFPKYRVRGGYLLLMPVPAAGESYYFEYQSGNWCASSGGIGQTAWAADTDVGVLDEKLMTAGIVWRWRQENGLDYGEDFAKYQARVLNAIARDTESETLNMGSKGANTGIVVPVGGWPLP